MAQKILLRRGIKANLPTLSEGEPAFCTDTKKVFIGTSSGNMPVTGNSLGTIDVTDFGAVGDGVTDDSQAFINAITEATKHKNVLFKIPGEIYKINQPINFYCDIMTVEAYGAVLDFSGINSGATAITVRTLSNAKPGDPNDAYHELIRKGQMHYMKGLYLIGNKNITGINFQADSATGGIAEGFNVEHCVVYNFNVGARLYTNSWVNAFISCGFSSNNIGIQVPSGGTNYSERITIIDTNIYDGNIGVSCNVNMAHMHFIGCSFDYLNVMAEVTTGRIYMTNCHLESTNDSDYYLKVTGNTSLMSLKNCEFYIGNFTYPVVNINNGAFLMDGAFIFFAAAPSTNFIYGSGTIKCNDVFASQAVTLYGSQAASLIGSTTDTTPPNNVTGLTTSNVTTTSLTLSWTASTSSDISSYDVYNGLTLLGNTTSSTYNVSGLTASTSYTFTVKAKDTSGNVASGTSVTKSTLTPDTTAPNDVTNLTAGTPTITSIPISWTLSTSNDVANYEVAYSSNGGSTYNIASNAVNSSSTNYTVNNLTQNTTYIIRVVAIDTSGNRSIGATVTVTTSSSADTTPPADVTNLAASNIYSNKLTLTWTASVSGDVASYDVYRGSSLIGNTAGATYNATGLTANTSYTFTVKTRDTSGNVSTGVSVTTSTNKLIISDSFNRADGSLGTADSGHSWSVLNDSAKVSAQQAVGTLVTNNLATINSGISNFTFQCNIICGTTGGGSIIIRGNDANATGDAWRNTLYFQMDKSNNLLKLNQDFNTDGTTTLLTSTSMALTAGQSYAVKIVCNASNVTVYIDGTQKLTTTTSAYSGQTSVGIYQWNTTPGFKYDNLTVESL